MPGWYRRRNRGAYQPALEGAPDPSAIFGANATGIWDDRSASFTGATWTNQAGGTDFTQVTVAHQPPAGTAINGRPTIQPDGVSDFMDAGTIASLLGASSTAYGIWAVVRPIGALVAGPPASTSDRFFITDTNGFMGLSAHSDPRGLHYSAVPTLFRTSTPGTMNTGEVYQVRLYLSGGTLRYRLATAGGVVGEGSVGSVPAMGAAGNLRLGRSYLAVYQQCDVAAVYTANVAPSAGQLAAIDAWTRSRWGV